MAAIFTNLYAKNEFTNSVDSLVPCILLSHNDEVIRGINLPSNWKTIELFFRWCIVGGSDSESTISTNTVHLFAGLCSGQYGRNAPTKHCVGFSWQDLSNFRSSSLIAMTHPSSSPANSVYAYEPDQFGGIVIVGTGAQAQLDWASGQGGAAQVPRYEVNWSSSFASASVAGHVWAPVRTVITRANTGYWTVTPGMLSSTDEFWVNVLNISQGAYHSNIQHSVRLHPSDDIGNWKYFYYELTSSRAVTLSSWGGATDAVIDGVQMDEATYGPIDSLNLYWYCMDRPKLKAAIRDIVITCKDVIIPATTLPTPSEFTASIYSDLPLLEWKNDGAAPTSLVLGYQLEMSYNTGSTWNYIKNHTTYQTPIISSSLPEITSSGYYSFRVRGYNDITTSLYSATRSINYVAGYPTNYPMLAWFKADDLNFLANGDVVGTGSATWYSTEHTSSFRTTYTASITASQYPVTESALPTYQLNTFGPGRNGVLFNSGSKGHLSMSRVITEFNGAGSKHSFAVVFKNQSTIENNNQGCILGPNQGAVDIRLQYGRSSVNTFAQTSDGATFNTSSTFSGSISASKFILMNHCPSNTSTIYENLYPRGTLSVTRLGGNFTNQRGYSVIGEASNFTQQFTGSIAELMLFNDCLTGSAVDKLFNNYILSRYPDADFHREENLSASQVQNLQVWNYGLFTASLSWSNALSPNWPGVYNYYIYRSSDAGVTYTGVTTSSVTTYIDSTSVQATSSYLYKVQAFNSYTTSKFSAPATLATPSTFGPDAYLLYAWWKADDLNLSNGDTVGTGSALWYGTSSISNTIITASAPITISPLSAPTYSVDAFGAGRDGITFNGLLTANSNYLTMSSPMSLATANVWTIAVVYNGRGAFDGNIMGHSSSNFQVRTWANGANRLGYFGGTDTVYSNTLSSSISQSRIAWWTHNVAGATQVEFAENGYYRPVGSGGSTGQLLLNVIGRTSYLNSAFSGTIAEICIWSASMNPNGGPEITSLYNNYFVLRYPGAGFYTI